MKSPTTIKGADTTRLAVFEGMTDFLSALQYYNITEFKTDVIIMHSRAFGTGLIREIKKHRQYKTIFLYLDNDLSGKETTEQFMTELPPETKVKPMNEFYTGYKDVNDFWQVYRNR